MLYGRRQMNPVSRFVNEISDDLIVSDGQTVQSTSFASQANRSYPFDRHGSSKRGNRPYRPAQKFQNNAGTGAEKKAWEVGDKVDHKAWGTGTIVKVSGSGENMELDIAFPEKGIKRLLATFAPIKKHE